MVTVFLFSWFRPNPDLPSRCTVITARSFGENYMLITVSVAFRQHTPGHNILFDPIIATTVQIRKALCASETFTTFKILLEHKDKNFAKLCLTFKLHKLLSTNI